MKNQVTSKMLIKTLLWTARAVAIVYTALLLAFFLGEGLMNIIKNVHLLFTQWPMILSIVSSVFATYKMFSAPVAAAKLFCLASLLMLINLLFIGNSKDYANVFTLVIPYIYAAFIIYIFRAEQI